MKARIILSLVWIAGSFFLLSCVLYAVNDYRSHMLEAVTGQLGTPPTLERVKTLETKLRQAKNIDEAHAIMDQISGDVGKYLSVGSASVALENVVERVWILWGVSATIPLLFLWWPLLSARWGRFQSTTDASASSPVQTEHK